jgi:hypothetical protein
MTIQDQDDDYDDCNNDGDGDDNHCYYRRKIMQNT